MSDTDVHRGKEAPIRLVVPGQPVGKQRARVTRYATYTPAKTVNYEGLIREMFAINYRGHGPFDGPVIMYIRAYMKTPKSSKKKTEQMLNQRIRPTTKPDIDNIIKIVCDALNGVAYVDDNRIVGLSASKRYSDTPRVEIELEEI
jgi:Holliday junction resolvase RusA-like endonuclease